MAGKKLRILLRNDLKANWELHNPILGKGEVGVCFDNGATRFKVGENNKHWNELPFANDYNDVIAALESRLDADETEFRAAIAQLTSDVAMLQSAVATKQDKLPEGDNGFYLHKNIETGAIEWAAVEQVTPTFAGLEGDPRDNEKLSAELDKVLADAEAYTNQEIGKLVQIKYAVVNDLPEASADVEFTKSGTIYLKKEAESGADIYNEFICINKGTEASPVYEWEQIGSTRIDLSAYRKAADQDAIDEAIEAQITAEVDRATGVEEALGGRLTTAEGEIDALQADSHTHANKAELDLIASGDVAKWNAKQNAISVGDNLKFENNKIELNFDILDGGDASDWGE